MNNVQLVELNEDNIRKKGLYCLRSMKKSDGYKQKENWMKERFSKGLTYLLLQKDQKSVGFIEYAPAEESWRVIHADNYFVIHCLWIGHPGQGLGSFLIHQCIEDAKKQNKHGIVVLTNCDTSWAPCSDIFIKNHFKLVEKGPYSFDLYAYKFADAPDPYFPNNWDERLRRFGDGLTIIRTNQCPYLEVATKNVVEAAKSVGIQPDIIEMNDRNKMMELAPTPYGVFNVVFNGELIAFHRLTPRSFAKKIKEEKTNVIAK